MVESSAPNSTNSLTQVPGGRRVVEIIALGAGVAAVMMVLEAVKQWLHPDITPWESHSITVAVSATAAAIAGHAVLRRGDRLRRRLVAEAEARQRAAEDAARVNSLLLATLESNRDGVLVVGLDGMVLTFNHQFLDMWGVPESVLLGPTAELRRYARAQLKNPEALTASVARFQTDTESESTDVLAFKDGRTVELFTAPQRLKGVVVGRVWRSRDVTAHRQAQQQIQMLAHTIRSVGECVSVTDMDDRILFVNQAFLDTYGFDESELVGQHIAVVRSPKTTSELVRQVLPATRQGGWRGELWNRRRTALTFRCSFQPPSCATKRAPPSRWSAWLGISPSRNARTTRSGAAASPSASSRSRRGSRISSTT